MKRVVKVTRATISNVSEDRQVEDKIVMEIVGKFMDVEQITRKYQKSELYAVGDFVRDIEHLECTYEMPIEEFTKLATCTEVKTID